MRFLLICLIIALIVTQVLCFQRPEFKTSHRNFHTKKNTGLKSSDGYKLPGNARPHFYEVTLTFDESPYNNYIIYGEVVITLDVDPSDNENKTDRLQLNAAINTNEFPMIIWNDVDECNMTNSGGVFIEFKCPNPIEGTNQKVKINYITNFASYDQNGVYEFAYHETGITEFMMATQLEEDYARRLFPCFDEPEYKAPIQLTLRTPLENFGSVISNTKVAETSDDGYTLTTKFEPTPNMSAYLLAFVVTNDFKQYSDENSKLDGYEFEVFARPNVDGYVGVALENGPKLIDLMGEFTGIKYPDLGYDRMVLAGIPEFSAGAMENWGLILFREQLLIDEGKERTAAKDLQYIIEVIAHETAHQWFGDYVTLDWWSETWLNEGFAQYFEYYLPSQISSEFDLLRQFVVKEKQQGLKTDADPNVVPLSRNAKDVTTESDFSEEFGDISYIKGASIIKILSYTLGQDNFRRGLQTYLQSNNHSNPSAKILIDTLQQEVPDSSLDLNTLFNEWIYENGYPLLDVSIDDKNIVTLKASRFSSSLNKTGENSTAIWWIPLTYTTSENPDFDTVSFDWRHSNELSSFSVPLPDDDEAWIIFNLQSIGFYRVNYDQTLWDRIIKVLNNSDTYQTIDVLNRAQLLDDIFNVAKSYQTDEDNGTLYYATAFKLAEYLKYETEFHPWYTFFTEMQYLMELIQDETTLAALKEKILNVVSPQLVIPKDTDELSHTEKLRRSLLLTWACELGHEDCVQWAIDSFEKYKENVSSIDNNYRYAIVCTGLSNTNNSRNDFDFILNRMKNSILPLEQIDLVTALTCINQDYLVQMLLKQTIDYTFYEQRFSRMYYDKILSTLYAGGSRKLTLALEFVLTCSNGIGQYWEAIDTPEQIFQTIATKIYSQKLLDRINQFIQDYTNERDYESRIEAAQEAKVIVQKNIEYLEAYSDVLTSVIQDEEDPPTPDDSRKISYNIFLMAVLTIILTYLQ